MDTITPAPITSNAAVSAAASAPGLTRILARALADEDPAGPLPPGPRANPWQRAGAVPGGAGAGADALLTALWRPRGMHRTPDGAVTSIARRLVPSAGGCYPVRTHLVAGGIRWAFDHESGALYRRDAGAERAAGWPGPDPRPTAPGPRIVFSVQPGRSFGRYRHRAWPLWIADTAYAVAATESILGSRLTGAGFGPSAELRRILGVPAASRTDLWLARGLVPEIPLAVGDLPAPTEAVPAVPGALAHRRSPEHGAFLAALASRGEALRGPARIAAASGQAWVAGASSVRSWTVPTTLAPAALASRLWSIHLAAARLCFAAVRRGDAAVRPISGFAAHRGRWIVHALAFLDTPGGHR